VGTGFLKNGCKIGPCFDTSETIEHLRLQNLEQAKAALEVLGFERLLKLIPDPSKGRVRQLIDPADGFGRERVQ
jgi:hypothetical protein